MRKPFHERSRPLLRTTKARHGVQMCSKADGEEKEMKRQDGEWGISSWSEKDGLSIVTVDSLGRSGEAISSKII